jgi:S-disulfanyl-L-cysteine oxidoreductase SoxD
MIIMRIRYAAALVTFGLLIAGGVEHAVVTAQSEKTVWSGIYTAEQATRGKTKAETTCGSCHAATMKGELAPALVGEEFIGHWYDAKLSELVMKVNQTMPADAPGSLKPEEYADIMAYLLQINGFPAGQEPLVLEPVASLDAVKITKTK